jgi:F420-0:gamma-glutamyl ligase
MQVIPYKLRPLVPPKDDLFEAIRVSKTHPQEGDIVVISSKVVSIGEGHTILASTMPKEALVQKEADWYLKMPNNPFRKWFTIRGGSFVGSAGIDESNGNGHYILYPKNPQKSAEELLKWFKKTYRVKKLGLIISDSMSIPLRRGAIGFAVAYSGFAPLKDYRGTKDIFGRAFKFEVANVADALAASANVVMGEGSEQTPLGVIHGAPVSFTAHEIKSNLTLAVSPTEDLFAPLFFSKKWKRGKHST